MRENEHMAFTKEELGSITTVLFDMDGTLLDSLGFLITTQFQTLEKYYPGKYTYEQVAGMFGTSFMQLIKAVDDVGCQAVFDEFVSAKVSGYHTNTKLFLGVLDGLKQLKEQGYKLGIVTNQDERAIINLIRVSGLDGMFETVVTHFASAKSKPAPDGILEALKSLGSFPSEAVMIGDSKTTSWQRKTSQSLPCCSSGTSIGGCRTIGRMEYNILDEFIEELVSSAVPDWQQR
jgi:pyrophosphatase PpaX